MIEHKYGKIINIASMTSFFGSERIPAQTQHQKQELLS